MNALRRLIKRVLYKGRGCQSRQIVEESLISGFAYLCKIALAFGCCAVGIVRSQECDVTPDDAIFLFFEDPTENSISSVICPFVGRFSKDKELKYLFTLAPRLQRFNGRTLDAAGVTTDFHTENFRAALEAIELRAKEVGDVESKLPRFIYLTGNPTSGTINPTLKISDRGVWRRHNGRWEIGDKSIGPVAYLPADALAFYGKFVALSTSCVGVGGNSVRVKTQAMDMEREVQKRWLEIQKKREMERLEAEIRRLESEIKSLNARIENAKREWERRGILDDQAINSLVTQVMRKARLDAALDGADPERAEQQVGRRERGKLEGERQQVMKEKERILMRAEVLLDEAGGVEAAKEAVTSRAVRDYLRDGRYDPYMAFNDALDYLSADRALRAMLAEKVSSLKKAKRDFGMLKK